MLLGANGMARSNPFTCASSAHMIIDCRRLQAFNLQRKLKTFFLDVTVIFENLANKISSPENPQHALQNHFASYLLSCFPCALEVLMSTCITAVYAQNLIIISSVGFTGEKDEFSLNVCRCVCALS